MLFLGEKKNKKIKAYKQFQPIDDCQAINVLF